MSAKHNRGGFAGGFERRLVGTLAGPADCFKRGSVAGSGAVRNGGVAESVVADLTHDGVLDVLVACYSLNPQTLLGGMRLHLFAGVLAPNAWAVVDEEFICEELVDQIPVPA